MDYVKIYDALISKARDRIPPLSYSERHHIIPRCMGGDSTSGNIVELSFREHYVAHLLLYKIHSYHYPDLIFAIDAFYRWDRHIHRDIHRMPKWIRKRLSLRRHQLKLEYRS